MKIQKIKSNNSLAFTLVELIVVITILAILGTIAFISLQWYSSDARDSARISDVNNMKTSLELFHLNSWRYPFPDNSENVTYSWWTVIVWKQWTLWDTVTSQLSKNLNKKPLDPLYEKEYIYSVVENANEYQILSVFESDLQANNLLLNNVNALDNSNVRLDGIYNWLYIKTTNYIIPSPSIVTSLNPAWLDFSIATIGSQVTDGGTNIPNIWTTKVVQSTWALVFNAFEVYEWVLDKNSDIGSYVSAYNVLLNTYSWSSIISDWVVNELLVQSNDEEKINFVNRAILKNNNSVVISDWRDIDSNCDKPDVVIWTQTWAWCNSTIWNWLEYGKNDNWTDGIIDTCYKAYDALTTIPADCVIDSIDMASNTKANTWFTWSNADWDIEFGSIWWKNYTWGNAASACIFWYHLPTDAELEYAEEYLIVADWWAPDCRVSDNWNCDWTGWKLHSTTNSTNNMVEKLKLPLSGFRDTDSTSYKHRGFRIALWSSTTDINDDQTGRLFGSSTEGIWRSFWPKTYAFNVRCIED